MHFPPNNHNLGFVAPSRFAPRLTATVTATPTITYTGTSGWAKRPVIPVYTPIKPPTLPPIPAPIPLVRSAPRVVRPLAVPDRLSPSMLTPSMADIMLNLPRDQFRYSEDQIREMLLRGRSETTERSGESDSGLPNAFDLEQEAAESDATNQFTKDAAGGAFPGVELTAKGNGPAASTKTGNALLIAGLLFLLFGV